MRLQHVVANTFVPLRRVRQPRPVASRWASAHCDSSKKPADNQGWIMSGMPLILAKLAENRSRSTGAVECECTRGWQRSNMVLNPNGVLRLAGAFENFPYLMVGFASLIIFRYDTANPR